MSTNKNDPNKEEIIMTAFSMRIPKHMVINGKKKAAPASLSEVVRTLILAWLNGEVDVVWENGEAKIKKNRIE